MQTRKNISWKEIPFLRLLLPFIAGILIQYFLPVNIFFYVRILCLSLVLFAFCHLISLSSFSNLSWAAGIAIHLILFSFGGIVMYLRKDIQVENSACYNKNQTNYLAARILSDPVSKPHSLKCLAQIQWLIRNDSCFHENENIIIYLKNTDSNRIAEGSLIILKKKPDPIANPNNSDFDYIKYCRLRHIYGQIFLKGRDFATIRCEKENSILSRLHAFRQYLLIIIKNELPSKSESGLLEAMLVGFRDDLDPLVMKSYTDTGVIHLIVISGLHLALICHILQLIFSKTGGKIKGRWIKLFLIITALWSYSLLCGGSPAIIRSALMFSIALIAKNISREAMLYNTLASSALLLICVDPYWIWDTGFQLSYAAVLGIRLFAEPVRNLMYLKNKILAGIWNGVSVSIAAQILTTPVSVFYFHRFPVYFLIANLVAVPLASVILAGGIILCCCNWFSPFAFLLAWWLGLLIRLLNGFIIQISKIPGAVVAQLYLTLPQLILLYIIIFCFYRFIKIKRKSWFIAALAFISIFQITRLLH